MEMKYYLANITALVMFSSVALQVNRALVRINLKLSETFYVRPFHRTVSLLRRFPQFIVTAMLV